LKQLERKVLQLQADLQEERHIHSHSRNKLEDEDTSLRMVVDNLNTDILKLKEELRTRTNEANEIQTSLRNEIHKTRQQLTASNQQLQQLDCLNSELQSSLDSVTAQLSLKTAASVAAAKTAEETDSLLLEQVKEKDAIIMRLKHQLEINRARHQDTSGLVAVHSEVQAAVQIIDQCSKCAILVSMLQGWISELVKYNPVHKFEEEESQGTSLDQELGRAGEIIDRVEEINLEDDLLLVNGPNTGTRMEEALDRYESDDNLLIPLEEESLGSLLQLQFSRCESEEMLDIEEEMLQNQLEELQEKLERMSGELTIVSEESRHLANSLIEKEQIIVHKRVEVEHLTLEHTKVVDTLEARVDDLTARVREKDRILRLLVPSCTLPLPSFLASFKEEGEEQELGLEEVKSLLAKRKISTEQLRKVSEVRRENSELGTKESVDLTLLPPENFRLTRRVGSDGLLVAWTTPEDNEITGYQIYVEGGLVHRVRSSTRTKALIHNLDLQADMQIRIHSTASEGRISAPETISYSPDIVLLKDKVKGKNISTA